MHVEAFGVLKFDFDFFRYMFKKETSEAFRFFPEI